MISICWQIFQIFKFRSWILYILIKEIFKKVSWIRSHHLQWEFKLFARKFTWGNKAKHCWVMSTNFLFSKVCWQCPAMFNLYTSSTPMIWIFTEDEGDGIKSRLPFKIFSTLNDISCISKFIYLLSSAWSSVGAVLTLLTLKLSVSALIAFKITAFIFYLNHFKFKVNWFKPVT